MNANMDKYLAIVMKLLDEFDDVIIKHVIRIKNEKVNTLAQIVSGYEVNKSTFVDMIHIKKYETS